MKIEAHIINWNEADIIALTVSHYKKFCDRIVIYDNYSDDGSDLIAKSMGCEVVKFGIPGMLCDGEYIKVKNNCWKNSDADWVIVCDCDEILFHEDISFLFKQEALKGATMLRTQGYNMYSNDMPVDSFLEIVTGFKDDSYSKLVCFKPEAVKEIAYIYGCHEARPVGNIQFSEETYALLHYRAIGGIDRLLRRHEKYVKRLSDLNRRWNLGEHYLHTEDRKRADFSDRLKKSKTLSLLGIG